MSHQPQSNSDPEDVSIPRLRSGDTLLVASHNQGKIAEMAALFTPYGLDITSSADLGLG